jgi:hypothetical protein
LSFVIFWRHSKTAHHSIPNWSTIFSSQFYDSASIIRENRYELAQKTLILDGNFPRSPHRTRFISIFFSFCQSIWVDAGGSFSGLIESGPSELLA